MKHSSFIGFLLSASVLTDLDLLLFGVTSSTWVLSISLNISADFLSLSWSLVILGEFKGFLDLFFSFTLVNSVIILDCAAALCNPLSSRLIFCLGVYPSLFGVLVPKLKLIRH